MNHVTNEQVRAFIKQPYTGIGGYTLALYTEDGERLCPACVQENLAQILLATRMPGGGSEFRQWRVIGIDVHWEGPDDFCAHCNVALPSEYGDIEEPCDSADVNETERG